jgi:NAD(P)-dependent dehydrogenase (short-subunit alcohol dehydrogenase family)
MLRDKVIIVTGGASGIGRDSSMLFAAEGAKVLVVDWHEEAGQSVVNEIRQTKGMAEFCRADVSKEADVRRMVDQAVNHFGRLDGAFNNASILGGQKQVRDVDFEEFQRIVSVNLSGVFLCMKYEMIAMAKTGGGSIVNNSAAGAQQSMPNNSSYIAAKAGVNGLTKAASTEAKLSRVRVNALLPGQINTPMVEALLNTPEYLEVAARNAIAERHSIGRFGMPFDVANAAAWLLSDKSAFINGVLLPVDGGYCAR